jgi:hypothetical protein
MALATVNEAIREMAWNIGNEYSDQAWLLSDYDVWTPNPHYSGPPQPHPEDDLEDDGCEYRDFSANIDSDEFVDLPF